MPKELDHIDGDPSNNVISNLREVTHRENSSNRPEHRKGKLIGTTYDKARRKWISQIQIDGKMRNLGRFDTELEAHEKYLETRRFLCNL